MTLFEITNVGRIDGAIGSAVMTEAEAIAAFGPAEFDEMRQGYLPNWVVIEL